MYLELAEQKSEKEQRQKEMLPKERDYDKEQEEAVKMVRQKELEGKIRQCNEGKWEFQFDEESRPGYVVLDIAVQKHLDSSLIDVDVNPEWVSVIVKSKVLRLLLPAEVKVGESKAQRSKTTGHLVLIMPKVDPKANMIALRSAQRERGTPQQQQQQENRALIKEVPGRVRKIGDGEQSLAEQMMQACTVKKGVSVRGIVKGGGGGVGSALKEVSSVYFDENKTDTTQEPVDLAQNDKNGPHDKAGEAEVYDDESVPPLM